MSGSRLTEIEDHVVVLTRALLDEYELKLKAGGLVATIQPIRRMGDGGSYSSELIVDFTNIACPREIADVIEFSICQEGRAAASLSNIEAWLREALDDVIERRQS